MNTRCLALVLSALLLPSAFAPAQGKDGAMLAPAYPASVAETYPGVTDAARRRLVDARSRTFYSKDRVGKVKAHYVKALGAFEEEVPADTVCVHHVVPFKDVVDIVTKRGASVGEGGESFWGGTMAGVTLSARSINTGASYPVTQVYEALLKAYLQKLQKAHGTDELIDGSKHLNDPELKAIENRYEHLKTAYYMQSNELRKDGTGFPLAMDEVIYNKYYVAPAEARTKEAEKLQKQLTDLMMQSRFDEATKVSDRLMKFMPGQEDPKEEMATAVQCLQEMEKHAYATRIVIDMHPSNWDLTTPAN